MNLAILAVISVILAVFFAKSRPRIVPKGLLLGTIAVIMDIAVESVWQTSGGGGYPNTLYMISFSYIRVPIEMLIISFSAGVILAALISMTSNKDNGVGIRKADYFLFGGGLLFFLYIIGFDSLLSAMAMLGIWGMIVSTKRKVLAVLFFVAWILSAILEIVFTTINEYFYVGGYDWLSVGILYGLTVLFLGGIITARSGSTIIKGGEK